MKKLLFYKPRVVFGGDNKKIPGIEKFSHFFKIFNEDVVIVDRTNTIKFPIHTASIFPLPTIQTFTKSYEEICNDRAKELLEKVEKLNLKLYVFYSGGIDSTLIVVSLLKNCTEKQKENIVILLSEESINENPNFYRDYINGKLAVEPSTNFPYLFGNSDKLFVTGEGNDQVFGSDMVGKLIITCGADVLHQKFDKDLFTKFFNTIIDNNEMNTFWVNIFEKLANNAPVKISTNFEFLWWINFSLKWQNVYLRVLAFTAKTNIKKLTEEYIKNNYCTFYNTEDFQLWSMNNLDKKIKNDWKSYKWVCKDIIYDFNKDTEYRDNKAKVGSLSRIVFGNDAFFFIDEDFNFYKELPIEEYYNPDNDFI